jgi:hypothetical protein
MVRTVVIPQNDIISLSIPSNYVGKKVEVIFYTSEEVMKESLECRPTNVARFKGLFTNEEADQYHQYLHKTRQEWERDI